MDELMSLSYAKRILITHSDVAYSNIYIEKYSSCLDTILTVNHYTQDKIRKRYSNRLCFIPNYVSSKLVETFERKNSSYRFGMFSRFSMDKNVPMFLESLLSVFETYPQYHLELIGSSDAKEYDEYLKRLCTKYGITKNVHFRGYQSDTKSWYEKMDFIILPSVSEGASYNILESMSYGVPVIASDVGGNHELIEHNANGICIFYSYIRQYEQEVFYITDYKKHLECIGYIEYTGKNKEEYLLSIPIPCEMVPPSFLKPICQNCSQCSICQKWKEKLRLWNINRNAITTAILQMIDSDKQIWIEKSRAKIKECYSEKKYYEQMFSILGNK
jgi:glycosyltransferase involved in cell wall biosynthesis